MWIFRNDAFVSIVAHRDRKDILLCRARIGGDLERAFPGAEVFTDDSADYRYRALISRTEVCEAISDALREVEYTNFKASVESHSRHEAYMKVWSVMANAFGAFGRKGAD